MPVKMISNTIEGLLAPKVANSMGFMEFSENLTLHLLWKNYIVAPQSIPL